MRVGSGRCGLFLIILLTFLNYIFNGTGLKIQLTGKKREMD